MAEEVEVTVIFDPDADYSDQDNYDDDHIGGAGHTDVQSYDNVDIIRRANRPFRVHNNSPNAPILPRLTQNQVITKSHRDSTNPNNPYGNVRSDVYDISSEEDNFRYETDKIRWDDHETEEEVPGDNLKRDEHIKIPRRVSQRSSRLDRDDRARMNPSPEPGLSKSDYELLVAMSESQLQNNLSLSPPDSERVLPTHPIYGTVEHPIYGSVEPRNDEDIEGLILPKKLSNPCKESKERQHLHRELLIKKKLGIDVLNQKSDLKRELDKRKSVMMQKEVEEREKNKLTPFQKKLEEQAEKLKKHEMKVEDPPPESKPEGAHKAAMSEFFQVHEKIRKSKKTQK